MLAALRAGLRDKDARKAAAVAVSYVQLVYGRQLQQPVDEQPIQDPLDVSAMTRERRDALKPSSADPLDVGACSKAPRRTPGRRGTRGRDRIPRAYGVTTTAPITRLGERRASSCKSRRSCQLLTRLNVLAAQAACLRVAARWRQLPQATLNGWGIVRSSLRQRE